MDKNIKSRGIMKHKYTWIRESNLIEGIDDEFEDEWGEIVWNLLRLEEFELDTVLWIHGQLLKYLNPRIAGHLRECDVQVGNYVCPTWENVPYLLENWITKYSKKTLKNFNINEIMLSHIEFEKIHPFEDGNGRIGRMLMNWQRERVSLEPLCIYEKEKQEYYKWFNEEY